MEILLIGNGFDLAHGLPTSYKNFLEFCERARRIYTYKESASVAEYARQNLYGWKMSDEIKGRLVDAYEHRSCIKAYAPDGTYHLNVTTTCGPLDELNTHVSHNAWLEYFLNCSSYIGENWIDFESEISRVIQTLDSVRVMVNNGGSVMDIQDSRTDILKAIADSSRVKAQNVFRDVKAIDRFAGFLNTELERLIRALEIYIAEFVGKILISTKNADIEALNPTHVLSFNYSDTYRRVYGQGKRIEYDYIHGKADILKNMASSNLVLGIDEYLGDDRKDKELEFLTFKKFYQRIYKSTGNRYLKWIDDIRNVGLNPTLYIFGHSLDVTDKDILKLLICNDNVQTKIFYYRENEDDKKTLGKLIRNLVRIMGQDELVRRTGSAHKTIEFIPQSLS